MDSVLMRTMTMKSVLGFGHNDVRDHTVGSLIGLGKHRVLINAYFGLDKINFIDDILDELGITEDLRIEKPGKLDKSDRPEARQKAFLNINADKTDEELDVFLKKGMEFKKRMAKVKLGHIERGLKKGYLRNWNHGNQIK